MEKSDAQAFCVLRRMLAEGLQNETISTEKGIILMKMIDTLERQGDVKDRQPIFKTKLTI